MPQFNRHYHKRSNVETVFHMLKVEFGDMVRQDAGGAGQRGADEGAVHNLCVLVHAMYALDVTPAFEQGAIAHLPPAA
ncbi:MAG: hypothetical protein F4X54_02685 [Chloroflexi bacterium]|nr:hypothetical protein [Chloroflexota bacterium]MYB83651.1 hypothetical protein [Chloroflexota bacterium]